MSRERGSTIPLLIFSSFVILALIVVTLSATSLLIERKRLYAVADGAALAACEQRDPTAYTYAEGVLTVKLTDAQVQDAVVAYLAALEQNHAPIDLESATSPDGKSARVRLSTMWRPPILSTLIPMELRLAVTATARSAFTAAN